MAETVITTTTAETFDADVVERSRERAVVVDFWADWCGPCHQLAPILERVAGRFTGDVEVRKLDVDAAPAVARRYRVQGIPALKAFRDGRVVAELTGVQTERALEDLFTKLAPSPADRLTAAAEEASEAEAESLLREALAHEPGHAGATVALAQRLADRREIDEAEQLLAAAPQDDRARELASRLALSRAGGGDLDALRERAATDASARVELGRALAGQERYEEALDELLSAVSDRSVREDARAAILEVFAALGDGHDLVARTRPRLANALYA
ncbi:tetratricopeptide repeat protein [Egibacter rhizosphaerae]|nr:tetratricopeptide repeat protein [Egibacter rhizosphaerae]